MEVVIPAKPESITLDIDRTALVVVDMQNAFAKKGGMLDVWGHSMKPGLTALSPITRK